MIYSDMKQFQQFLLVIFTFDCFKMGFNEKAHIALYL
jgi:hypothetical protein